MDANMQRPNVALLMHIWKAFNRNDLETVSKMVSEGVVYRVSGRGPVSGMYDGRLTFMKSVQKVKEKRFILLDPSYEPHARGGYERVKCE